MRRVARIHLRIFTTSLLVFHIIRWSLADVEAPPEYLFAFGGGDEVCVIMRWGLETRSLRGFRRFIVVGTRRRPMELAAGGALMVLLVAWWLCTAEPPNLFAIPMGSNRENIFGSWFLLLGIPTSLMPVNLRIQEFLDSKISSHDQKQTRSGMDK